MKEGWEVKKLGEVCEFIGGYTPSKELVSEKGDTPYFKVSDMNTIGNEMYLVITPLTLLSPKKIIPKGSIVFPKNGGAIYTNKKRILAQDSVIDLNTEALYPKNKIISSDYLFRFLLSIDLGMFDNGGGLPSINMKRMKSTLIHVPPLSEQQRIVSILDAEFAKIERLKTNAERNLQNAKDLFQSALKKELEPKKGWKEYRIDKISTISPSKSEVKKKNLNNVDIVSFLPMEDMTIGIKDVYPSKTITLEKGAGSYTYFEENDVLLAKVSPCFQNGKLGIVRDLKNKVGFGSSEFIVFRVNKELIIPDYLYYCMRETDFLEEGKKRMFGACGLKRLSKDYVKERPINIPPLSEQQSIVSRLDILNDKCNTLQLNYEKEIALCEDLKQAILRKAFNGEI